MMTTTWSRWAWPILSGHTRQVALPIAFVVGTILLAVNQGTELAAGEADVATLFRALANYLIPYSVSSVSYLNARNSPGVPFMTEVPQP
ncbi:nitrate/nitrite transporter NrtS [Nocardioides sp.]|uniref:nitrate/nitrite transporter NrtS n=1 Tax=Nocardioides sp. TaxID=35761 RepID=UPI003D10BF8F